jgi:regulator of cell morphogenesis and NO signaling
MVNVNETVAGVVLDHSECAAVFQKHHIDFCCRGAMSVADAANLRGVDVNNLLVELDNAIAARSGATGPDVREMSTARLVAHIIATHHEYLRTAMPFVITLAAKVSRVHGEHNPKLKDLDHAVRALNDLLLPHLDEEEQVLFPALMTPTADVAKTTALIDAMKNEHLAVAAILEKIRAATDEFTLPEWACNSYRTLFGELAHVESDVFTHVHLENHVLAPRVGAARR